MPGFNRKGPTGAGARTGGGMGYCGQGRNVDRPGFGLGRGGASYGGGRGRGWGGGRGMNRERFEHGLHQEADHREHDSRDQLAEHVAWLEQELTAAREQLEKVGKK